MGVSPVPTGGTPVVQVFWSASLSASLSCEKSVSSTQRVAECFLELRKERFVHAFGSGESAKLGEGFVERGFGRNCRLERRRIPNPKRSRRGGRMTGGDARRPV
ncbi:MAG: hypothetical protein B1H03_03120 [Planctomycetales bacterium 4484_113]|nr:MAG: hypothetical protein B1H03_03120 [Planctomycetales bacterium 4484_113]